MSTSSATETGPDGVDRCWWCTASDSYRTYHDEEWGRPVRSNRRLYEKICLEGFQAGLSWRTILDKREAFRRAFDGFDFTKVASYEDSDVERLLGNDGIVRNRAKIESAIHNARRAIELIEEAGSLARFVWQFEPSADRRPDAVTREFFEECTETPESRALAEALSERDWTYVGPTTMYALMRAVGLVNDHVEGCELRPRCAESRRSFDRPPPPDDRPSD